ncbi:MAG: GNAT family N-acetyltransferase [bacterium]
MQIISVQTSPHLNEIRTLFREYEQFLNVDLCFQGFEEELATLPGKYAPPGGALFLALENRSAAGCVAVRTLDDATCEMKRLFVRPGFRGIGLGKQLATVVIAEALRLGFKRMRLDTLESLTAAMGLYHSLGFRQVDAYYHNPLQNVIYWELSLGEE